MKKILSIILILSLIMITSVAASAAQNNEIKENNMSKEEIKNYTDNLEKEISEIYNAEFSKGNKLVLEILEKEKIDKNSKEALDIRNEKIKEHYMIAKQKERTFMLENGWSLVKQPKENSIVKISSSSSNLQFDDYLYYNSSSNMFRYAGSVEFTQYDQYYDIEDIVF